MALLFKLIFPNFLYANLLETAFKTKRKDPKRNEQDEGKPFQVNPNTFNDKYELHNEEKPQIVKMIEENLKTSVAVSFKRSLLNLYQIMKCAKAVIKKCPCKYNQKISPLNIKRDEIEDYEMINKGMGLVMGTLDLYKLIKNIRLLKLMSQVLMTKDHKKFIPYLHDSHLDFSIIKAKRKKFIATIKQAHNLGSGSKKLRVKTPEENEIENVKKLDVDNIYRECDTDKVSKTIIRNLIDSDALHSKA